MPTFINTKTVRDSGLPFSQAVRASNLIFLSGAVGNKPGLMELVAGGIEAESRQMMQNIEAVLEQAGSGFDHVVKCVVYFANMADWPAFNAIYVPYFRTGRFPARTAIGASQLIMNARVEMECWAEAGS